MHASPIVTNLKAEPVTPAGKAAPTIYDVQLRVLELITLLDVLDFHADEIHFPDMDKERMNNATRVVNLVSVAGHLARGIDATIDDLLERGMA